MGIKLDSTGKEPGTLPVSGSIRVLFPELLTHLGIAPPSHAPTSQPATDGSVCLKSLETFSATRWQSPESSVSP